MSAALQPMTIAEFLAWEERQTLRWEFDGIEPVLMPGVTRAHATIQANLMIAVGSRLRGTPCRMFGETLKVRADEAIRYPDGFVACSPGLGEDTVVTDPVVVFEIASKRTALTDRVLKLREYQATPSICRYVLLEQVRAAATVFARDGERWLASVVLPDAPLTFPELGIEVPLLELYDGVMFPKRRRSRWVRVPVTDDAPAS